MAAFLIVLLGLVAGIGLLVTLAGVRTSRRRRREWSADSAWIRQLRALNSERPGGAR